MDFKQILENQPFVTMRLFYEDGVWNTWYITPNVSKFGFSSDDFQSGKITWSKMLHPDDRVVALKLARDYLAKGVNEFRLHYRILTKTGENVYITEFSHINRDAMGRVLCVDSVLVNTTTVQNDANIAHNHFRQQAMMNDILLSLQEADLETSLRIILAKAGNYLDTSRALLFKDSPDHKTCKVAYEWLNQGITSIKDLDYAVTYSEEMPELYLALQQSGLLIVNAGEIPENCREEFKREGLISTAIFAVYVRGEQYGFVCFDDCVIHRQWDDDTVGFLKNVANLISNVLMRMEQEERLQEHEAEIRRLAFTDHLTGLPNRFRCDADLAEALQESRATGRSGHALFIDLDDFKIVNDCYGHDFGDGVLVSFAQYADEFLAGRGTVYRFGGDEFVIITREDDDERIRTLLDELLARARQPWQALGREFYCSLSIGVVKFNACEDDSRSVVKKADIAMYSAKKAGKNNYAYYADSLSTDSRKRSEVEAMLRNAMLNSFQGFIVHYQPYSDTRTKQIVGAEALLRMTGPDGSLVLPDEFLPLAEYLGFIGPIGEYVLEHAARQCRAINAIPGFEDFTVAVNISPRQLKQAGIVRRTVEILTATEIDLRNIVIAINEKSALDGNEAMLRICVEFKNQGIRTALNDFGSGSSSFINMRDLPVDIIKVSSKYVEDVQDRFAGSFLKLVTELAHFTGKKVCMNGVERDAEYAFCKELGIDMVQGFLLHRPGDWNALLDVLSSRMTKVFYRTEEEGRKNA